MCASPIFQPDHTLFVAYHFTSKLQILGYIVAGRFNINICWVGNIAIAFDLLEGL